MRRTDHKALAFLAEPRCYRDLMTEFDVRYAWAVEVVQRLLRDGLVEEAERRSVAVGPKTVFWRRTEAGTAALAQFEAEDSALLRALWLPKTVNELVNQLPYSRTALHHRLKAAIKSGDVVIVEHRQVGKTRAIVYGRGP